jgi:hypothetical protein
LVDASNPILKHYGNLEEFSISRAIDVREIDEWKTERLRVI